MQSKKCHWAAFLLIFIGVGCFSQEVAQAADKLELKLEILSWNKTGPEYIFVIGSARFKTVKELKQFLGGLSKGSEIIWAPGCISLGNEPLLSSNEDMKSFRSFLEAKGIKFILLPSG